MERSPESREGLTQIALFLGDHRQGRVGDDALRIHLEHHFEGVSSVAVSTGCQVDLPHQLGEPEIPGIMPADQLHDRESPLMVALDDGDPGLIPHALDSSHGSDPGMEDGPPRHYSLGKRLRNSTLVAQPHYPVLDPVRGSEYNSKSQSRLVAFRLLRDGPLQPIIEGD